MTDGREDQSFLRRKDAAKYLLDTYCIPCGTKTLANYASTGKGPAFHYAGRYPIYSRTELDKWARLHIGPLPTGPRRRHAENV